MSSESLSVGVTVRATGLVKRYGKVAALSLPQLDIQPGECVGLVGNNGAGKTTFLRLLLDLIRPTEGAVTLDGIQVEGSAEWKTRVGAFLDPAFLVDYLKPDEYFRLVGGAYGLDAETIDQRVTSYANFLGPATRDGSLLRDLSTGNANKVGIVSAFLPQPGLVMLDEPYANLDPGARIQLEGLIRRESTERGATVLVSSHDLDHVVDVCTRVLVLAEGRVVRDTPSTPDTLRELRAFFAAGGRQLEHAALE
ncbi:MAG: ABC transporter ATP-binding protein [Rubricoccaceae bacterium]